MVSGGHSVIFVILGILSTSSCFQFTHRGPNKTIFSKILHRPVSSSLWYADRDAGTDSWQILSKTERWVNSCTENSPQSYLRKSITVRSFCSFALFFCLFDSWRLLSHLGRAWAVNLVPSALTHIFILHSLFCRRYAPLTLVVFCLSPHFPSEGVVWCFLSHCE